MGNSMASHRLEEMIPSTAQINRAEIREDTAARHQQPLTPEAIVTENDERDSDQEGTNSLGSSVRFTPSPSVVSMKRPWVGNSTRSSPMFENVKRARMSPVYDLSSVQYTFVGEDGACRRVCLSTLLRNKEKRLPTLHYWYDFEVFCKLHQLSLEDLEPRNLAGYINNEIYPIRDEASWGLLLCELQERLQLAYQRQEPLPHFTIGPEATFWETDGLNVSQEAKTMDQTVTYIQSIIVEDLPQPQAKDVIGSQQAGQVKEISLGTPTEHAIYSDTARDQEGRNECGPKIKLETDRDEEAWPCLEPTMRLDHKNNLCGTSLSTQSDRMQEKLLTALRKCDEDNTRCASGVEEGQMADDINASTLGIFKPADNTTAIENAQEYSAVNLALNQEMVQVVRDGNIAQDVVSLISEDESEASNSSEHLHYDDTLNANIDDFGIKEIENDLTTFARETSKVAILDQVMENVSVITEEEWKECCKLLRHPVHLQGANEGKLLLGSRRRLSPQQMIIIYRFVRNVASGTGNGLLICEDGHAEAPRTKLSIALFHRLSFANKEHYQKFPGQHKGTMEKHIECLAGHPFGIECVCVSNSMTRTFVEQVVRGPILVVTPPPLMKSWAREIESYFSPFLESEGRCRTVQVVIIGPTGKLVARKLDGEMTSVSVEDITTAATFLERMTLRQFEEMKGNPKFDLRSFEGVEMAPRPNIDQSVFLLLMSASVFAMPSTGNLLATKVVIKRKDSTVICHEKLPWALVPSYCAIADSQKIYDLKEENARILKKLTNVTMRRNRSLRSTMTILTRSPAYDQGIGGIQKLIKLLCPNETTKDSIEPFAEYRRMGRNLLIARLGLLNSGNITAAAKSDLKQRIQGFSESYVRFIKPWMAPDGHSLRHIGSTCATATTQQSQPTVTVRILPSCDDQEAVVKPIRDVVKVSALERKEGCKGPISLQAMTTVSDFETLCAIELLPPLAKFLQPCKVFQNSEEVCRVVTLLPNCYVEEFDCPQLRVLGRILQKVRSTARGTPMNTCEVDHIVILVSWLPRQTMMLMSIWLRHHLSSRRFDVISLQDQLSGSEKNAIIEELSSQAKTRRRRKSFVILMTNQLLGLEWNKLSFANYFIQWGEPPDLLPLQQLLVRLSLREQTRPVHDVRFHADRLNTAEGALRSRKEGRVDLMRLNTVFGNEH